jgi:hypothetical protein
MKLPPNHLLIRGGHLFDEGKRSPQGRFFL